MTRHAYGEGNITTLSRELHRGCNVDSLEPNRGLDAHNGADSKRRPPQLGPDDHSIFCAHEPDPNRALCPRLEMERDLDTTKNKIPVRPLGSAAVICTMARAGVERITTLGWG
ncbi:hypothetical protein NDU88_012248 [Pleurodeles waltl]|uniref:Uncharacterized protein n=1 Tax=Pleurodeles waltl TaxID=8319 RepID=A0AAV7R135_PLEWA|nr:hypothetical protein NDU88_012248 [Pleurodeles waltl]